MNIQRDKGIPDPLNDPRDGHILSRAIIDTIREPLIVLDNNLRVLAASRSFYEVFGGDHTQIYGQLFYELNGGLWNIQKLKELLGKIIPEDATIDEFEIEYSIPPASGPRTMLISARKVHYKDRRQKILISISDVTEQRALQVERTNLLRQKDLLMKEMRHRIANSLQLIASILLLKAGIVESKETRQHLEDAHERIMSIATVQQQLDPGGIGEQISVEKYLKSLCESLARSMIGGRKPITLDVKSASGTVTSEVAISLGLLTTELVINAIKHAFPGNRPGKIVVSYEATKTMWRLTVSDNGIGRREDKEGERNGLGTSIVAALAEQLNAEVSMESTSQGTAVSFTHIYQKS